MLFETFATSIEPNLFPVHASGSLNGEIKLTMAIEGKHVQKIQSLHRESNTKSQKTKPWREPIQYSVDASNQFIIVFLSLFLFHHWLYDMYMIVAIKSYCEHE